MTPSAGSSPVVARRGVLLLVVLSLLTLFMLLGTTFLVLSSRARTTARAYLRLAEDQTRTADGYGPFLREAAMQVIRGTSRPNSAVKFHDLLGDRYGIDGGQEFLIGDPHLVAGDQVLGFQLRVNNGNETNKVLEPGAPANRTGQVLTFLEPPLAGTSLRIITSLDQANLDSNFVYVLKPAKLADAASLDETRVWINHRDFSGTGLTPAGANWGQVEGRPVGSSNEGYDAADSQNLAIQIPKNRSFGPLGAPVAVPEDIDADGDGEKDSIWLDLGIAPFSMPDRTLVKPLFAIKCIDLGGRVNLNVHGSPAHLTDPPAANNPGIVKSGSEVPQLRPGLGFTPLDVRLDRVIDARGLERVLQGSPATTRSQPGPIERRVPAMVGRYGGPLDRSAAADAVPLALVPRLRGVDPDPAQGLYAGGPSDFWSRVSVAIDPWGKPLYQAQQGMAGADVRMPPSDLDLTRPRICAPVFGELQGALASLDQPYTPVEMEALLRPYDFDNAAILPQRLLATALDLGQLDTFRNSCTTESWDTPAVIGGVPEFIGSDAVSRSNFDPDLVGGLRMDLNRPIGDGVANPDRQRLLPFGRPIGMPLQPGEQDDKQSRDAGLLARQVFAWHLYNVLISLESVEAAANQVAQPARLALAAGSWAGNKFQPREPTLDITDHNDKVLAQWAVNVVDFMDSDSIMTPFRFKPGTGWKNVVWGCEAPDLMITETLALHDRGIADTDKDTATQKKVGNQPGDDNDWDQVRRPRGSLFVELYRVRGAPPGGRLPRELYEQNNSLDLGKRPTANATEPIWRLAIQAPRDAGDDLFSDLQKEPDTEWLSPPDTGDDRVGKRQSVDRFVWFSGQAPSGNGPGKVKPTNTYVRKAGNAVLEQHQHLVVGPRRETPLGDAKDADEPSPQKIVLDPTGSVRVTNLDGDETANASARVCLVELAKIENNVKGGSGLNVSEPLGGLSDKYYDGDDGFYDPPKDSPFEETMPPSLLAQGTHANVSTVFLQRLADPTRPHEPDSSKLGWNPYVTVDFMPIDLHVFNGSAAEQESYGINRPPPHPDVDWHFHTRQRGLGTDKAGKPLGSGLKQPTPFNNGAAAAGKQPPLTANPWIPVWPGEAGNPPGERQKTPDEAKAFFGYTLNHPDGEPDTCPRHTLGSWNISFGGVGDNGQPTMPFPWIVWNDRPFASPYELLLVPRTPPGRLLTNYRNPSQDPAGNRPPLPPGNFDGYGVSPRAGHLLPFTGINDLGGGTNADILSRLFGYVRVMSPFAGTNLVLADRAFDLTKDGPVATRWREPFNVVPTYREPGGINLNTVPPGADGKRIWDAILGLGDGQSPTAGPSWADIEGLRDKQQPLIQPPSSHAGRAGTLLRDKAPDEPLFGPPRIAADPSGSAQYRYEERNTWFAYEPLIKAATHTTTRSEVYAIWITMGFFEASTLREYGSRTGDIRRHRAFYMYDRSIPVGYQPGTDLNVANGILVERLVD
jgi:hypothetical protein